MWVGYYQQRWTQVLAASVRLAWLGFGTDWGRTLQGAWLLLRAIQLWAPFPGNDPHGPRPACVSYTRWSSSATASPPTGAGRRPRGRLVAGAPGASAFARSSETNDELVESVTRLHCCVFGEAEAEVRPAAAHRVRAMDLSDQWVREGCQPDSPLLPLEHAALVRAYAALLAAVHHDKRR